MPANKANGDLKGRASLVSSQTRLSSCASWLIMMTPPGKASSASASASMDCGRGEGIGSGVGFWGCGLERGDDHRGALQHSSREQRPVLETKCEPALNLRSSSGVKAYKT